MNEKEKSRGMPLVGAEEFPPPGRSEGHRSRTCQWRGSSDDDNKTTWRLSFISLSRQVDDAGSTRQVVQWPGNIWTKISTMNHRHRFAQQQRPPVLADCTRNKSRNKIKQKKSIDSSSRNAALLDGSGRTTTNQTFFFLFILRKKRWKARAAGLGGNRCLIHL